MGYVNEWALVDGTWLSARLGDPKIKIVDASWFLPTANRDGIDAFTKAHIPGAVFFDIEDISQQHPTLPHMAPDAVTFTAKVGALGISHHDTVVVYDTNGGFCAALRAWWLFRLFGHEDVLVLNGGLPRWVAAGHPTESGASTAHVAVSFASTGRNESLIRLVDQMRANTKSHAEQVIDARSPERFTGAEPEPRPSPRMGHIPGSINIPFGAFMDGDNHFTFHPEETLRQVFSDAGIDIEKPVTVSCGSGVTACVPAFALFLLGKSDAAVYDGSWAEWGDNGDLPIQK